MLDVRPAAYASARRFLTLPTAVALRDGGRVVLRGARRHDAGELAAMHARCSVSSLEGRYGAPAPRVTGGLLADLLRTEGSVVAVGASGAVVATGNLAAAEGDRSGCAEVAVLVEDAWQGRGLGSALVRHLLAAGRLLGYRQVAMVSAADDRWPVAVLSRWGTAVEEALPSGHLVTRLALAPHHVGMLGAPALPGQRTVVTRRRAG